MFVRILQAAISRVSHIKTHLRVADCKNLGH